MAGLISEVTVGQSSEFLARLGRKGFDIELLKKSLGDDAMIERMVAAALVEPTRTFPIWRTITIGGKSKDELLTELESAGFKIGDFARSMMESKDFTVSPERRELQIVRPTVGELGLGDGATTQEIWDRGQNLGLELCPAEVGPHLRLQYPDQLKGEWVRIAMKQIAGSDGYPLVFDVDHDNDGRWLDGNDAGPENEWNPDDTFVFVRPRA